jgi:hypothetical protein
MAIEICKDKFVIEAAMHMGAGQSANSGYGIEASKAVVDARDLFNALVDAGHIVDTANESD